MSSKGLLRFKEIRFILIGGINTAFSYSIYALMLFLGLNYSLANFIAMATGVIFSFRTQGIFVFRVAEKRLFWRFLLCWIFIYILNILIIRQIMQFGPGPYVSGAIAMIPVTALSYFAQNMFVFMRRT